jgi:hypothetical protein
MKFRRFRARAVLFGSAIAIASVVPGALPAQAAKNLVSNGGLEKLSKGFPQCWNKWGSAGTSAQTTVVHKAHQGKNALQVTVTKWSGGMSGAVLSAACAIKVAPGQRFNLAAYYKASTGGAKITVFKHRKGGPWSAWQSGSALPKSPTKWRRAQAHTPVVPTGTDAIRWSVTLSGKGTLVTDDYAAARLPGTWPTSGCSGDACTKGVWKVITPKAKNAVRAIHSVLLYNGQVLLIAGSGNDDKYFAAGTFTTKLWNPVKNTFTNIPTPADFFCAGHVQLKDGRVLVMGGTKAYGKYNAQGVQTQGFLGLRKSYIFDPKTNRYTRTNDPIDGHWYPSATELANGDVFSVGGSADEWKAGANGTLDSFQSPYTERWSAKANRWLKVNEVKQGFQDWDDYPALILMQDGRLFYTGSNVFGTGTRSPGIYDDANNTKAPVYTEIGGLRDQLYRDQSASVLLDPAQDQKVMIMGGSNWQNLGAINKTDIIDLKKANPKYKAGPDLPHGMMDMGDGTLGQQTGGQGKLYLSAVLLPNGKVFETGGSYHMKAENVFESSMYDAKTNKFTPVAYDPVGRTYHAQAMLLPDGRVLAVGSNPGGDDRAKAFDTRLSVYSPPYLFKGGRPSVSVTKKGWAYGSTQKLKIDGSVASARLIRPAAVTHSSDPNQRSVALPLKVSGGSATVKVTNNPNLAPPGWYMLFVTSKAGVPSVAKWVHVG